MHAFLDAAADRPSRRCCQPKRHRRCFEGASCLSLHSIAWWCEKWILCRGQGQTSNNANSPLSLKYYYDGKIGDSYSLEVRVLHMYTPRPFFITFFGCHHYFAFYLSHTPMSRLSKNTRLIDSLSETTCFANSNLLNITNALCTS